MTLHRITSAALMDVLHPPGLTEQESLVLLAIASGRGHPVTSEEVIEVLYGLDQAGGALWARNVLRIYAYRLRKKGYNVVARYGWGYSLEPAKPPKRKRAA